MGKRMTQTLGDTKRHRGGKRSGAAAAAIALLLAGVICALAGPVRAEGKKLEVIADKLAVHLEPDARSPVVETLARGAVLTMSSAIKFRTNWFYVLFLSSKSGRTLTGYVLDQDVRKLNSSLRIVNLSPTKDGTVSHKEMDLSTIHLPTLAWGRTQASILGTEGRPLGQEAEAGLEVLRYERDILDKKCLVVYLFDGQQLVGIRLQLLERYADKNCYISDYNKIRDFLNQKVGGPRYDNVVWRDHAHAEQNAEWGQALAAGRLTLTSEWAYRDTGLRLSLNGDNTEISFAAEIKDIKAKNPASF
jgi:hypothetical protein